MQNLTPDTLPPRTSPESGPDPAPRRGVACCPLAGSRAAIWHMPAASGDTIVTWNDSAPAARHDGGSLGVRVVRY
jgi:hypothetical protein